MNKLDSFPPIYYINLDYRTDRNEHIEKLIKIHNLNATRISATNGSESLESLLDSMPSGLRPNEIACTLSHLRAIQHWLHTSDTETAVICEDDVSFDSVDSWNFSWKDVMKALPYYWEIFQCSIIYHPKHEIVLNLHNRSTFNYSAACYVIKRSYAERLMSYYWNTITQRWKLDYISAVPLTSEETIFRPGACLSLPLFSFTNEHGSNIQTQDHIETYHIFSKKIHTLLWQQIAQSSIQLLQMNPSITFNG